MNVPAARLAFSIPTTGEAEQRQLFGEFRAAGFQGLQLKGGQYERYLMEPEQFKEEWLRDGAACSGLIWGGALDPDGMAALREVLSFAWAVGSERVIFCHNHPHHGVTPGNLQTYARLLSELGQEAGQAGLKLSLHHHFNQPVMLPEELRIFFEAARPGAVGLTLDTAHLAKSGVSDTA
ncbi:MAG: TIM barrel protein, partial [Armatimonadota bacterium]|nr:TIM barrel protein [Armatimonadota bacterium]